MRLGTGIRAQLPVCSANRQRLRANVQRCWERSCQLSEILYAAKAVLFLWAVFFAIVSCGICIDIWSLRGGNSMGTRRPARVVAAWVSAAMLFGGLICHVLGRDSWLNFTGGYALELSLAVDNLFVFMVVFEYFKITGVAQRKALAYGIIGAIAMRMFFILAGVTLLNRFKWLTYVFGAMLIISAFGMFRVGAGAHKQQRLLSQMVKLLRIRRGRNCLQFFVKCNGRWHATHLFACVIAVEVIDIIFSADSVPAILAITREPLIVCSSNIFAIIGLRALYAVLARLANRFCMLRYGVAVVLVFIGFKMVLADVYHISTVASVAAMGIILAAAIGASFLASSGPKSKGNA
jgi:tellurite resistance protein TerC